ncbi:hypothetical protein ACHAXT_000729 [Thalassiosira profunda]
MDRVAAMLALLGLIVILLLIFLALFSVAPFFSFCLFFLVYILWYFIANEASGIHHAQEFENRFWTVFAVLLASACTFVNDSPLYMGDTHPGWGLLLVLVLGYAVHMWDRIMHRKAMSRRSTGLRRGASAAQSLVKLSAMVEDPLEKIGLAMANIDQLLVPSTINNLINTKFILRNEREIITVFEEAQPKTLNYLISHVKLALVFYKIKDHRNFRGQHRTELIELLAVDRVSVLTIHSRVLLLRALQLMKLPANPRAEHWVRNIILSTHQDELSELKTMTDSKGDYFCMNKLIYDDIRSETVRQDILSHFKKEAAVQQAHMDMGTRRALLRMQKGWRKILSDVDDTLTSSGGSYPAGIDKRYAKKVVYPGVIALYRELDLPLTSPEECPRNTGNLVFLSARPHLYKDFSEKHNFAKFQKLRQREGIDGRGGLHTTPSLLAGDLTSGREFIMSNDFEPLARKKFDNFRRFVSIYPEYRHVFVCDNGQGDVRAGELMHDQYPKLLDGLFVHVVQDVHKTFGFDAERWRRKGLLHKTCFFRTYPDAALFAATQRPPYIKMRGLMRVCQDACVDFNLITSSNQWASESQQRDRRIELNQSLCRCNKVLESHGGVDTVPLLDSPRKWEDGEKVRTSYGIGVIKAFDPTWDLYEVELDWRPLDVQVKEYEEQEVKKQEAAETRGTLRALGSKIADRNQMLQTVVEEEDESNHLSPTASFDASKKSSKQSLTDQMGRLTPAPSDENLAVLPPTPECSGHEFVFDAGLFDRKATQSPQPTLDETTGTSALLEEASDTKAGSSAPPPIVGGGETAPKTNALQRGKFVAKLQGKDITKYTPPSLPKMPKEEKRSKFSFWDTDSVKGTVDKGADKPKAKYSPGERVTTPYGIGVVVEHRQKAQIVVVDMTGPWVARAYLQEHIVKREGAGFLGTILGRFSSSQTSPKRRLTIATSANEIVAGTPIFSPFGEGTVTRPLPLPSIPSPASSTATPKAITKQATRPDTLAIKLTSWTLRDGRHPTLYCSAESAVKWRHKQYASTPGHNRDSSVFSLIGSLVSGTVESLKKIRVPREIEAPIKVPTLKFERYYKDGAAVTTAYGDGTVRAFRESDGFYIVSLSFGTAFLREDSMSYRLARGCVEGYPVMTTWGSGVLQSVNPTTGVHTVTVPSFGGVCYLQPDQILRPLKAAVGEDVSTRFGEGKVFRYRLGDNKYEIRLAWGGNAMLYCNAETFDRIDDRLEDKGGFGVGWVLNFFYNREEGKEEGPHRSRSNSFTASALSETQSVVSLRSSVR